MGRWGLGLLLVLAACGPPPTPFAITPVATRPPTDAPAAVGGAAPDLLPTREPIRYGVLPNAAEAIPAGELRALNAQVDVLDAQSAVEQYDVLVGYGLYDGWTEGPTVTRAALVLNPALAPLDNPEMAALVREAVRPAEVVAALGIPGAAALTENPQETRSLRERLANLGYPDGITIYGRGAALPGVAETFASFGGVNIEVVNVPGTQLTPHLSVIAWREDAERAALVEQYGAENVIDLYALPISFYTDGDLLTTFTDEGWVIAARRD